MGTEKESECFNTYVWHIRHIMLASLMGKIPFAWDEDKDGENFGKHGVLFSQAQQAFGDPRRVVAEDVAHSQGEKRYYCFGRVEGGILTVRFIYRDEVVRIFGAGYWRRGKAIYERENQG